MLSDAARSLGVVATKSDGRIELEVGDRVVKISNPDRVYFSARGETKLDLARYYLSVADGIVNALYHRPCMLHRFPDGVDGEKVHQKRLPRGAPEWVETVRVHFPRYNRYADELCVTHPADVVWAVQMSTVEFHPWNSRRDDTEKPDEWRIDLDPMPEADYDDVRRVAGSWSRRCWPSSVRSAIRRPPAARVCTSTSGSRPTTASPTSDGPPGRSPARSSDGADGLVDLTWWRKDRDPAIDLRRLQPERPRPHDRQRLLGARHARWVWCRHRFAGTRSPRPSPRDFTIATMPARFAELGDLHADIDDHPYALDTLLEWAERDERAGKAPAEPSD